MKLLSSTAHISKVDLIKGVMHLQKNIRCDSKVNGKIIKRITPLKIWFHRLRFSLLCFCLYTGSQKVLLLKSCQEKSLYYLQFITFLIDLDFWAVLHIFLGYIYIVYDHGRMHSIIVIITGKRFRNWIQILDEVVSILLCANFFLDKNESTYSSPNTVK